MLNIELNIVGFRFTRGIPDQRRKALRSGRFGTRPTQWRIPYLRQSHAA